MILATTLRGSCVWGLRLTYGLHLRLRRIGYFLATTLTRVLGEWGCLVPMVCAYVSDR